MWGLKHSDQGGQTRPSGLLQEAATDAPGDLQRAGALCQRAAKNLAQDLQKLEELGNQLQPEEICPELDKLQAWCCWKPAVCGHQIYS